MHGECPDWAVGLTHRASMDCHQQFIQVGWMYRDGQGVPQDDAGAVKWFRMAVEQGNASAQNGLRFMYAAGKGVPQDGQDFAVCLGRCSTKECRMPFWKPWARS